MDNAVLSTQTNQEYLGEAIEIKSDSQMKSGRNSKARKAYRSKVITCQQAFVYRVNRDLDIAFPGWRKNNNNA